MTGPIGETTVTLGDERDRLDARLDDLAESLASADTDTQGAQWLRQQANEIDQQGNGVAYLIDEYGADAEVTVRGLDAGGFAQVEDRIADINAGADGPGNNPGSARNVWAATGLVDAPFFDEKPDSGNSAYRQKLDAVAAQPVGVAKWLEALVNEETSVEGNWKPLSERIADSSTA